VTKRNKRDSVQKQIDMLSSKKKT